METQTKEDIFRKKLQEYTQVEWSLVGSYSGWHKPVELRHKVCGKTVIHSIAKNVFRIKSCRHCSPKYHKQTTEVVNKILKKFGLKLVGEYVDDRTPVQILYSCGHVHVKAPTQVKQGIGVRCLLCLPRSPSNRLSIEDAQQCMLDAEFGRFTIVGEYTGITNKTDIKCLDCGAIEYSSSPNDVLQRSGGCHLCGKIGIESVNHRFVKRILNDMGIKYITEHSFGGLVSDLGYSLRFDFFLPDYNLVIEYDGEYHSREYFVKRDAIKDKYCLENDIKILRLPSNERGVIQKILDNIKCND